MKIKNCYICYERVGVNACGGYNCIHCGYTPNWGNDYKDSSSLKEDENGKLEKLQAEEVVLRSDEKESVGEEVGG